MLNLCHSAATTISAFSFFLFLHSPLHDHHDRSEIHESSHSAATTIEMIMLSRDTYGWAGRRMGGWAVGFAGGRAGGWIRGTVAGSRLLAAGGGWWKAGSGRPAPVGGWSVAGGGRWLVGRRQQIEGRWAAGGGRQAAGGRQQAVGGRQQVTGGRQRTAVGRGWQPVTGGRSPELAGLQTVGG